MLDPKSLNQVQQYVQQIVMGLSQIVGNESLLWIYLSPQNQSLMLDDASEPVADIRGFDVVVMSPREGLVF